MIKIRRMTFDDVELGLKLSRQAGLNQTRSDWQRFLVMEPKGCFVAELDKRSVGTITTCVFDSIAWVAMLIVDINYRNKGIGTDLLQYAINYLKSKELKTVRLDATPAGQPIYEKLGFIAEYRLARFEGIAQSGRKSESVTKANSEMYISIIEFDRLMTGTNREKMLSRLFEEFPDNILIIRDNNKIQGYIITRPGTNAIQIGPCIATDDAGSVLLQNALFHYAGESVFIDIPMHNNSAVKIADLSVLKVQRNFLRMYRGQQIKDNIQALWASSGPEKG